MIEKEGKGVVLAARIINSARVPNRCCLARGRWKGGGWGDAAVAGGYLTDGGLNNGKRQENQGARAKETTTFRDASS